MSADHLINQSIYLYILSHHIVYTQLLEIWLSKNHKAECEKCPNTDQKKLRLCTYFTQYLGSTRVPINQPIHASLTYVSYTKSWICVCDCVCVCVCVCMCVCVCVCVCMNACVQVCVRVCLNQSVSHIKLKPKLFLPKTEIRCSSVKFLLLDHWLSYQQIGI